MCRELQKVKEGAGLGKASENVAESEPFMYVLSLALVCSLSDENVEAGFSVGFSV